MNRKSLFVPVCIAAAGLVTVVGSIAIAQPSKDPKPHAPVGGGQPPQMALPPGWTEADMQACMMAGMPGKMHEHLAKSVGVWLGKTTMWMGPGMEPMKSECTSTVKPMMD